MRGRPLVGSIAQSGIGIIWGFEFELSFKIQAEASPTCPLGPLHSQPVGGGGGDGGGGGGGNGPPSECGGGGGGDG
jgi:hypothetical protein